MRWTRYFIPTLKEEPKEAEVISHKLMLRAGLVRKLASGAYTYLPIGLRVLKKIENIIREEMNKKGAVELLMPAIQPIELWQGSGRFKDLGEDLIRFKDRHGKEIVFGPTHEEVITDLVRNHIRSYRELPLLLYQIQTKFRDEIRPRFGIIRTREFIMKDAYSFDRDEKALDESYKKMYEAYESIFKRCGLKAIAVEADPGIMGGDVSHEFMVLAESGEDLLIICEGCGYAASLEVAESRSWKLETRNLKLEDLSQIKEVDTPGVTTIEKVGALLKTEPKQMIKTLIYEADGEPVAILIRGDHEVNETKLKRFLKSESLKMSEPTTIEKVTGAPVGFAGPIGLKVKIFADFDIQNLKDFVTGANKKDKHLINVNLGRDFQVSQWGDFRYVKDRDLCTKCRKPLKLQHAIEVGHVFKLGTKYSKAMSAVYLDREGKEKPIIMGCYGIGVNRILAANIEQSFDQKGIIWPVGIAPFQVIILPLNYSDTEIKSLSENIYSRLLETGIEVLIDDRDVSSGVKFNDAELIGIPLILIIGQRSKKTKELEIKVRRTGEVLTSKESTIIEDIRKLLL